MYAGLIICLFNVLEFASDKMIGFFDVATQLWLYEPETAW